MGRKVFYTLLLDISVVKVPVIQKADVHVLRHDSNVHLFLQIGKVLFVEI